MRKRAPIRPICSKSRSTSRNTAWATAINVAVTARSAGRVTLDVVGDRLITSTSQSVQPGVNKLKFTIGKDWGNGAYVVATLRRPLDTKANRMPGRSIGVQWFSIDRKAKTLALDMNLPALLRPNTQLRVPVKVNGLAVGRGGAHRRRRRRCRHPQSDQLQAAGARRLLSRPAPAHRRDPRSLRPIDRRHAGHARTDPHRRRRRTPARSKAVRRRRSRSRSIPGWSPSSATAPPKCCSTFRPLPAPCA